MSIELDAAIRFTLVFNFGHKKIGLKRTKSCRRYRLMYQYSVPNAGYQPWRKCERDAGADQGNPVLHQKNPLSQPGGGGTSSTKIFPVLKF